MTTESGSGNGGSGGGERTFSQADVNRMIAEERRKTEARFGDYDQLKREAEATRKVADAQKSDVDKLTESVRALTERAQKAEEKALRRDVADRLKLPAFLAAKLTASTEADLEREGRELIEGLKAMGVKFDGDGSGGTGSDGGETGGGAGGTDGAGSSGDGGKGKTGGGTSNSGGGTGGRPQETLRPGMAGGGKTDEDVSKVADDLLSRSF